MHRGDTQTTACDFYGLVGLVVRRPPRERKVRVRIPLAPGFVSGRVIPVTQKLALQWLYLARRLAL